MLSVNSGPSEIHVDRRQRGSEISKVLLHTSARLAECRSEAVEEIIQEAIDTIREIEHAEQNGWYLLTESGMLRDVFHSTHDGLAPRAIFGGTLNKVPWCRSQVHAGKAVVIDSMDHLPQAARIDQQFFRSHGVQSVVMLPSNSISPGKTVLILLSMSTEIEWSDGIAEQYTLLENIFTNAYQRRLAQDESKATVKCFQQLFLMSTTAMALLGNKGEFISTNHAFRDILGYSEAQLQHMKCDDITEPAKQAKSRSHLLYLCHGVNANHRQCELNLIRKNSSTMPARIKIDLIERNSLEQSLSLMSIEDLTEQNDRENELCRRKTEIGLLASQLIQSQENERKRLSRELHDDIGQRLSLAASEAARLASQKGDIASCDGRLDMLRDELDGLCSDIHEMSHSLHSYKLQHLGLKSALKDLCLRLTQTNFRVELHVDDFEEPKSKDTALCLYRVAQESLNNALKHAHTSVVAITLTKLNDTFFMTVQDSGVGFDPNISSPGLGLLSMSERLKLVNGQFNLYSLPGRGTEIWVQIPDNRVPENN